MHRPTDSARRGFPWLVEFARAARTRGSWLMLPQNLFRLLAALATTACLGLGLRDAVAQFWSCDDAFISFRYAENLVDGLGLVFNAGERVGGYPTFAWTLLFAAGLTPGFVPVPSTGCLCRGCYAAPLT